MSERYSRRDFLIGALTCGTLTAGALYLLPGGRATPSVELVLATGSDDTGARQILVDMWNKANPDVQVRTLVVGGDTGDQRREMVGLAQNRQVDILNLDIIHIHHFARQELITPIELTNTNVFLERTTVASRVEGERNRYWATPFNTDVGMLFERRPADDTTADDRGLAAVIDGAVPGSRTFVGQLRPTASDSHEAFVVNVLEHALSRDPTIVDDSGAPAYELERWRAALDPLRAAIADGRVALADTEGAALDIFAGNDPARPRFMRNWPVSYRALQERNDPDARAGRIRVGSLPVGVLGGQNLAIVNGSRNAALAADFIRYVTDEPAQKVLAAHGLVPTRISAYNDTNLRAFIPHLDEVRGAVERARPRPIHANYAAFAAAVVTHVAPYLHADAELTPQFIEDLVVSLV